jgi:MFS family permease
MRDPTGPLPRSTPQLLTDRTFAPFFFGNLLSNCGLWFHNIAAAVVVFNLTGSALLVGLVSVMLFLATLILSPYAGALTDRVDRRRLMLLGQVLACAAATALAVWVGLVGVEGLPGPWPVLAATGVILVDPVDLDGAVALSSVTFNIARAAGPAAAAATLVLAGPAVAFGVNALSYLGLITALLLISPREVGSEGRGDGSVGEGLRYVRANPAVGLLLIATMGLGFGTDPVNTLTPSIAAQLGGGDGLVGLLVSAFGAGAVLATVVAARLGRRFGQVTVGAGGMVGLSLGMIALASSGTVPAALASLALAGAGFLLGVTGLTTAMQRIIPEGLRGRVMALWSMAFLGSRPIAALADGAIADAASPQVATLLAAVCAGGAAGLLIVRIRARSRHPTAATPTSPKVR